MEKSLFSFVWMALLAGDFINASLKHKVVYDMIGPANRDLRNWVDRKTEGNKMGQNDLEIYENLRFKQFSQGCEGQAYGMLRAIEPYLLSDFAYKHSLMRIFFRPLFYMGYKDPRTPMTVVRTYGTQEPNCYKNADALYRYMEENILLAARVIEELNLCCDYYDVEYCKKLNAVLFREHIFHDIDELREIFLEDFRKLNIPDDEIFRIFEEESDSYYLSEFSKMQT